MYKLGKTSLKRLAGGVHPRVVAFMMELIRISPHDFNIAQGVRTAAEQNAHFQKGRTKKGVIVTGCDGYKKKSNHQKKWDGMGYAADIAVLVKNEKTGIVEYKGAPEDFHYYQDIYETAKKAGLLEKYGIEWGGNCWGSFVDAPHFQIKGAGTVPFMKEGDDA